MPLTLAAMVLLAAAQTGPAATADTIALTHAVVIDGTGAAPRADVTVVIRGGWIVAVYPAGSRKVPDGARVEDLRGKWVMPGLIDAHVHLAGENGDLAQYSGRLRRLLLGGVTGVRDMGGDARVLGYLAREARLDAPGWPDVYYSALMAGPTFFFEDARDNPRIPATTQGVLMGSAPWLRAVDETTDIRMAVAEAKGTGATGIKLYANLPATLVRIISAEAHRQGLLVWAHAAVFPAKPSDAVSAGVDTVSHTPYLAWEAARRIPVDYHWRTHADFIHVRPDDGKIVALLGQMKERGTILDATLRVLREVNEHSPGAVGEGILPWSYAVTRAAHEAGVLVDAGTDSGGLVSDKDADAGPAIAEEMALLVHECGFTPAAAIQAATQVSAMAVGRSADRGTIAEGMAADLVVLSADPTVDIGNVRKVVEVVKDGKIFRSEEKR